MDTIRKTYGYKYTSLNEAGASLGFTIPESIPLSINDVEDIIHYKKEIPSIFYAKDWYMLRSSSPFEGDGSGGKLSWVYKSIFVKNASDILSGIEELIHHNKKDYIQNLHKNLWYDEHPFIPIIIQPYIPGIYAGVISKYGNDIFLDISAWNNHKITQWTSREDIHYEWKIDENRRLITDIKSTSFVLGEVLSPIQKCIDFYREKDWIVEFTCTEIWFVLLQVKTYETTNKEKIEPKYQSNFFSYEACFSDIERIMSIMWYSSDEFSIQQDDHITLYTYLWINRWSDESLEHIRIWIHEHKIEFEPIREWVATTVFPKDHKIQALWLEFFKKYNVGIIFNTLWRKDEAIYTRYIYKNTEWEHKIVFYDRLDDHGFDTHEKYFFLQSIRTRWEFQLRSTQETYTKLYRNMSFLLQIGIADTAFFEWKKPLLEKNIKKYLWILQACRQSGLTRDEKIIGKFMMNSEEPYQKYRICDIQTVSEKNICEGVRKNNEWIAYVCHDFEPIFIPYVENIDVFIIARASVNSHAVCIAKEYKKNILFQTRNLDLIETSDLIEFKHYSWETEIKKIDYAH